MTKLVQQYDNEIVLRTVVVVQPEVEVEIAAELTVNIGRPRIQLFAGSFIG